MATGAEAHVGPSSVAGTFLVIYALYCNVLVYQLFGGCGAGAMALRRHFDHPFPNIHELGPAIVCGESGTHCVLI